MKNKILLKIITPQGIIINCLINIITIKTINGYIGVLYGHIPLISIIVPSKATYIINDKKYELYISNGILQIEQKIIKIISEKVIIID